MYVTSGAASGGATNSGSSGTGTGTNSATPAPSPGPVPAQSSEPIEPGTDLAVSIGRDLGSENLPTEF